MGQKTQGANNQKKQRGQSLGESNQQQKQEIIKEDSGELFGQNQGINFRVGHSELLQNECNQLQPDQKKVARVSGQSAYMIDGSVSQEKMRKTIGGSTESPFAPEESHRGADLVVRTHGFSELNNFDDCQFNNDDPNSTMAELQNTMGSKRQRHSEAQSPMAQLRPSKFLKSQDGSNLSDMLQQSTQVESPCTVVTSTPVKLRHSNNQMANLRMRTDAAPCDVPPFQTIDEDMDELVEGADSLKYKKHKQSKSDNCLEDENNDELFETVHLTNQDKTKLKLKKGQTSGYRLERFGKSQQYINSQEIVDHNIEHMVGHHNVQSPKQLVQNGEIDRLNKIFEENDQSFQEIMDGYAPIENELDQFGRKDTQLFLTNLDIHQSQYNVYKRKYQRLKQNGYWSPESLLAKIRENPIICCKYNYTLDMALQNHIQFESRVTLSEDGKSLIIENRKMNTNPIYKYEKTPQQIQDEELKFKQAKLNGVEYKEEEMPDEFTFIQSNSSCLIDDIQGIIMGGSNSRFWIYRKHLISIDYDKINFDSQLPGVHNSHPFFAWQCLSLEFSTRTVDLVIKDDKQMDLLVGYLVQAMKTIDGKKGSANLYIEGSIIYEIKRRERYNNKRRLKIRAKILEDGPLASDEEFDEELQLTTLSQEEIDQIRIEKTIEIYRQTMFKYKLIRIRQKISYYAFKKRKTVNELIIWKILKSYNHLVYTKQITQAAPYSKQFMDEFDKKLDAPNTQLIEFMMFLANNPELKLRKKQLKYQKEMKRLGIKKQTMTKYDEHRLNVFIQKTFGDDSLDLIEDTRRRYNIIKENRKMNSAGNCSLFDKSKCADIYLMTKVDGTNIYDIRSKKVMLKYKFDKTSIEQKLNKINCMIEFAELIEIFYIKAVLIKKSLIKQLFVLDLEHNQEVYIPNELSSELYPVSFRYYDPIIQISNQLFSHKQKLYHCLKTEFYVKKIKGNDFKRAFLEKYGVLTTEKNIKQKFKHELMKEHDQNLIKYTQSKHHVALQKSRYLMVESTEESLKKLAELQTYVIEKNYERGPGEIPKNLEDEMLELRFCKKHIVNLKRQKFMVFKQSQCAKHDHLRTQGQKFNTILLVDRFIRENLEYLYKNRNRQINYNPNQLQKNLDLIDFNQLTDRQRCLLNQDKYVYKEWLLSKYETNIMLRRSHLRQKQIAEILKECDISKPYEERNNFIEKRLENGFRYFNNLNDADSGVSEIDILRKNIEIKKKQNRARAGRVPKEMVLSIMTSESEIDFNSTASQSSFCQPPNKQQYQYQQNIFMRKTRVQMTG